jgi:hypothetical protein
MDSISQRGRSCPRLEEHLRGPGHDHLVGRTALELPLQRPVECVLTERPVGRRLILAGLRVIPVCAIMPFVGDGAQHKKLVAEPQWQRSVSWLWLPVALLLAGYLAVVLVAWCIDGIRNIGTVHDTGRRDDRSPLLVALAVMPFLAWFATYLVVLRGWSHRTGRAFVATIVSAIAAFLALVYRALMSAECSARIICRLARRRSPLDIGGSTPSLCPS